MARAPRKNVKKPVAKETFLTPKGRGRITHREHVAIALMRSFWEGKNTWTPSQIYELVVSTAESIGVTINPKTEESLRVLCVNSLEVRRLLARENNASGMEFMHPTSRFIDAADEVRETLENLQFDTPFMRHRSELLLLHQILEPRALRATTQKEHAIHHAGVARKLRIKLAKQVTRWESPLTDLDEDDAETSDVDMEGPELEVPQPITPLRQSTSFHQQLPTPNTAGRPVHQDKGKARARDPTPGPSGLNGGDFLRSQGYIPPNMNTPESMPRRVRGAPTLEYPSTPTRDSFRGSFHTALEESACGGNCVSDIRVLEDTNKKLTASIMEKTKEIADLREKAKIAETRRGEAADELATVLQERESARAQVEELKATISMLEEDLRSNESDLEEAMKAMSRMQQRDARRNAKQ